MLSLIKKYQSLLGSILLNIFCIGLYLKVWYSSKDDGNYSLIIINASLVTLLIYDSIKRLKSKTDFVYVWHSRHIGWFIAYFSLEHYRLTIDDSYAILATIASHIACLSYYFFLVQLPEIEKEEKLKTLFSLYKWLSVVCIIILLGFSFLGIHEKELLLVISFLPRYTSIIVGSFFLLHFYSKYKTLDDLVLKDYYSKLILGMGLFAIGVLVHVFLIGLKLEYDDWKVVPLQLGVFAEGLVFLVLIKQDSFFNSYDSLQVSPENQINISQNPSDKGNNHIITPVKDNINSKGKIEVPQESVYSLEGKELLILFKEKINDSLDKLQSLDSKSNIDPSLSMITDKIYSETGYRGIICWKINRSVPCGYKKINELHRKNKGRKFKNIKDYQDEVWAFNDKKWCEVKIKEFAEYKKVVTITIGRNIKEALKIEDPSIFFDLVLGERVLYEMSLSQKTLGEISELIKCPKSNIRTKIQKMVTILNEVSNDL